jgi:hypothetical protein
MSIDFASFDIAELDVLDSTDAVALPEMGASFIIIFANTEDGDEVLGDDALNGSGSASTSSSSS